MREAGFLGLREAPPGCLKPLGCSWSLDLRAKGLGLCRKPLGRGVVQKGFGGPMENGVRYRYRAYCGCVGPGMSACAIKVEGA